MTLEETLAEACRLLTRGVADRRHPFHTPTLATRGLDGAPAVRTLVLRGHDPAARTLRLHSDRRSAKIAELRAEPCCALHCYDSGAAIQLRLTGRATLHGDDGVADAAWGASRPFSRMCYAADPAPGTPVAGPIAAPTDAAAGRPHFIVILLRYDRLEWLHLAAAGHRRARFGWRDGQPAASWLAP